jgi:hypothetical protein
MPSHLRAALALVWLSSTGLAACGSDPSASGGADAPSVDANADNPHLQPDATELPDSAPCEDPPTPAGGEATLAAEFAPHYRVYALGPVPGVPDPLGGVVVKRGSGEDSDTLLFAGMSESPDGGVYSVRVRRSCRHIVGFDGTATRAAETPYVDANLVYGAGDVLLYSEWPQYTVSQLEPGASTPAVRTDLRPLGIAAAPDQGPGGLGFVPPGLAAAGQLRLVTWPAGHWYHVGITFNAVSRTYTIDSLTEAAQLLNQPGGFAYVPAGSPGFVQQSILVAEWQDDQDPTLDRVAAYEANSDGDPVPSSRREFFTSFPGPWGAYFEPVTGDYLFLTWGQGADQVYIVQGFVPPPS